ncbi:MAG: hypothetical protein ABSA10_10345, partial [Anaerolineales bacterium]
KDLRTLNSLFQIVYDERNVRHSPDKLRKRTTLFETHPFNSERVGFKAGDVHAECRKIFFYRPRRAGRDTQMMVSPSVSDKDRGKLVILAAGVG